MLGDPNIDELYLDYLASIGYWESILTLADVAKLSITYLTVGTDKALNQLTQYLKAKATMSPSQITEIGKILLSFYQRRGKRREHHESGSSEEAKENDCCDCGNHGAISIWDGFLTCFGTRRQTSGTMAAKRSAVD